MPTMHTRMRSEATYRIVFGDVARKPIGDVARKVADVLSAFQAAEITVSAHTGDLVAYVTIPADVLPEDLDRKADALRAQWEATIATEEI
jgi:hypothetical protein